MQERSHHAISNRFPQLQLTATAQQQLRATVIDEATPQVTGPHLLPLNARLSEPLQHGLSRPQQKSFPHINGLFWLARATGRMTIDATGKKPRVLLDKTTMASWQTLNPTEQYCTLLESWTLRAPSNTEVRVGALPLRLGETMTCHYDFGDDWRFAVMLERIEPSPVHQKKATLLESTGEAPKQYPSWDDGEAPEQYSSWADDA